MHGKAKAAELWHQHNLSVPVDLKRLVRELGLEVVTFPFKGRLQEVILDRVIGVRPGLTRSWLRWYVAHAIGHYVLHVGASFHPEAWQWVSHAKSERQAEEFAAWLLAGPDGWRLSHEELGIPSEKLSLVRALAESSSVTSDSEISSL